jgi:DNA-3-methyladenine glycosylase I
MKLAEGLVRSDDGVVRCFWSGGDPIYVRYHDDEWGKPTHDRHRLFEKLVLEGFQSGLSWITILRKRERFREVFAGFDPDAVARFGARDVARLLRDEGIIRHRGKIEAAIHNARMTLELEREVTLDECLWSFVPPKSERPKRMTLGALRAMPTTPASIRMAKDLKKRGFRFVGPTTCYALMQAMGMVDDHIEGCASRRSRG